MKSFASNLSAAYGAGFLHEDFFSILNETASHVSWHSYQHQFRCVMLFVHTVFPHSYYCLFRVITNLYVSAFSSDKW